MEKVWYWSITAFFIVACFGYIFFCGCVWYKKAINPADESWSLYGSTGTLGDSLNPVVTLFMIILLLNQITVSKKHHEQQLNTVGKQHGEQLKQIDSHHREQLKESEKLHREQIEHTEKIHKQQLEEERNKIKQEFFISQTKSKKEKIKSDLDNYKSFLDEINTNKCLADKIMFNSVRHIEGDSGVINFGSRFLTSSLSRVTGIAEINSLHSLLEIANSLFASRNQDDTLKKMQYENYISVVNEIMLLLQYHVKPDTEKKVRELELESEGVEKILSGVVGQYFTVHE